MRGALAVTDNGRRKKLGEYLLEAGLLNEDQLKEALRRQRQTREPLGQILARGGMVTEGDVCRVLHQQLGLPIVDLASLAIDEGAIALVKEELAKKYTAMPVEVENRNTIRVAMADPLNASALEDIRFQSGYFVRPVLAPPSEILEAISRYYHMDDSVVQVLETIIKNDPAREVRELVEEVTDESPEELERLGSGSPIVRLTNWLISRAVELRASDIHIEPQEKAVSVRIRVDGLLQDLERLPKWTQGALVSRIKILASLDIAEKRMPQDGRIRVESEGRRIDLRVSTLPTLQGEKVVIRIADQERSALRLDTLGLSPEGLERLRAYGARPQGILIVTGPTGSGKTTLLYSLLQQIHTVAKNIVTAEDPIEHQIPGVNQVQVDERGKKSFASVLRAMLRQDPDIMMVGEIRDADTAQIAFRASITGHLVLTTVHTNDAASAVTRLVDLGLAPYMVASSLIGVVSMRLVRTLCPKCKDAYVPTGDVLRRLGLSGRDARDFVLYRPVGCDLCAQTGFRGRTGVFEVLEMDEALRRLVSSGATEAMVRSAAVEAGMVTIGQDGLSKVLAGETTFEELTRVVSTEDEGGRICTGCHQTVSFEYSFCPHCGTRAALTCLGCGRRAAPDWSFCPACGRAREDAPAFESEPESESAAAARLDPSRFTP
ncbi:MAG TPA: ATPase, T2SS/T4P/T4SS family [Candidatus Eisenbacteria bacterium]